MHRDTLDGARDYAMILFQYPEHKGNPVNNNRTRPIWYYHIQVE